MSYIRRPTNCVKSVQIRSKNFSGPCFPAFRLNTERYGVSLPIQSECGKIQTRKNSLFGHFSHSDKWTYHWCQKELQKKRIGKFETIVHKTSEFLFYPCPFFAFRCVKQNLDIVGKTKQINLEDRHGTRFSQIFFLYRYLTKF